MTKTSFESRVEILREHMTREDFQSFKDSSEYWGSVYILQDITPEEKRIARQKLHIALEMEGAHADTL